LKTGEALSHRKERTPEAKAYNIGDHAAVIRMAGKSPFCRSYDGADGSVLPTNAVKFGVHRQIALIQGCPVELHAPPA
jgi:hypothetical protein